jgi:predicted Zn-dependent protease
VGLGGCKTNPATGDKILSLQSRDDLIKLGSEAAPQFTEQFGGKVPDVELQAYVTEIGSKMAAKTEADNPTLPWEFTLLNTDVINAFALPGGKVFFTRGLAAKLDNEAQMAGVLGHEIGHVTAEHAARRISQQMLFNVGVAGAAIAVGVSDENSDFRKWGQYGVPALAVGGNLLILKFGRDEENQADKLGMRYMTAVGYNPEAQKQVMQILARESGPRGTPEWLATHPYPETRVQRIDVLLQTEYANTRDNPQYVFNEQQYRAQFLSRLNKLPPAPPPPQQPTGASDATGGRLLALGDPATWCGHCAAARRADSGQWTMDSGHR